MGNGRERLGAPFGHLEPDRDLEQLFRRLIFNILTSNADDHLRNHRFLRRGNGWGVSPADDMNPNPEHLGPLTTAIDGAVNDADIELARSVSFAFRLRSIGDTSRVIADVERATRDWRSVASGYGIGRRETDRMAAAFETNHRAVARRLSG